MPLRAGNSSLRGDGRRVGPVVIRHVKRVKRAVLIEVTSQVVIARAIPRARTPVRVVVVPEFKRGKVTVGRSLARLPGLHVVDRCTLALIGAQVVALRKLVIRAIP